MAPSLVGHKRAVSLSGMDPYATLLAQSRHEYYSRLTGSTQLGAKHGKHTLNQYLLAAFVGSRSTAEHAWLQAGLYPIGNFVGKGTSAVSSLGVEGVAALSQDNQIALLKDFSLVSSGLNLNLFRQRALLRGTLANTTLGRVLHNDDKFSVAPGIPSKLKSGTHVFRAHASATYVGNRLNRVYSHLAATSVLPAEFTQAARQGFFLQGLTKAASGRLSSVPAYQVVRVDVRPFLDGKAVVQSANVGSNLWLLRDFRVCADVAQPWLLALSQTLPRPSASLPSSRNDSVIARLAGGTNEAGTSLPSFQRSSISWAIGVASLKSASVE